MPCPGPCDIRAKATTNDLTALPHLPHADKNDINSRVSVDPMSPDPRMASEDNVYLLPMYVLKVPYPSDVNAWRRRVRHSTLQLGLALALSYLEAPAPYIFYGCDSHPRPREIHACLRSGAVIAVHLRYIHRDALSKGVVLVLPGRGPVVSPMPLPSVMFKAPFGCHFISKSSYYILLASF